MEAVLAHIVSEAEAEAVLAELRPWLRDRPPIDPFREQLEAIVEPIWAIQCVAGHYHAVGMALRKLRPPVQRAKTVLRAMEESATSPEMVNYADLLKLNVMSTVRLAVIELHLVLDRVPPAFSGRHKPGKGPAPRAWYFGFVRHLAGIAYRLGIELTIGGGGWSDDTHATPFTRFVFAVEKLLPRKARSNSLTACAKQIERAVKASAHEIDFEQAFMASLQEFGSERAFKAFVREFRKKTRRKKRSSKPAHSLLDK
jgi:hypothetical protein